MPRLYLRMPRPLKNLNEVKTVFSHFEQYGRLKEFVLHKVLLPFPYFQRGSWLIILQDFFTRQRSGTGALTYADNAISISLLQKKEQVLYFPINPSHQSASQSASNDSRNGNLSGCSDSLKERQEEFVITIQKSHDTLQNVIERRANKMLKTNDVTQSRINQHMLKGFKGYHGELSRLWERIGESARERSVRMIALDRLQNERRPRTGGMTRAGESRRGYREEGEDGQRDGERDGREWTDAGADSWLGNEGNVETGEVKKGVKVERVEERLEKTVEALNNLGLEVGGDTSKHPVKPEKA